MPIASVKEVSDLVMAITAFLLASANLTSLPLVTLQLCMRGSTTARNCPPSKALERPPRAREYPMRIKWDKLTNWEVYAGMNLAVDGRVISVCVFACAHTYLALWQPCQGLHCNSGHTDKRMLTQHFPGNIARTLEQ